MINIDLSKCIGCGLCAKDCQCSDIKIQNNKAISLNKFCLNCGHCIAICPQNAVIIDTYDMSEVKDYNNENFVINPETFLNSIKFRRSIRHFIDKPIEKEKIKKIIEAGRFTPTGGNRQPISYIVIQEQIAELTQKTIKVLYDKACSFKEDENNPNSIENKRYSTMWKFMYRQYQRGKDTLFFNAPAMIVILGDTRISINSDVDGALAASTMEMMANTLNLGACYNGFFALAAQNDIIKDFLYIPKNKKVITSILIGYTDNKYFRTVPRKKAEVQWM